MNLKKDCQIPFLDTLITRKPDGTVKLLIYRKPTHTDQYLNFNSHHLLQHKLGVIRTLLDRAHRVVTDTDDRKKEEDYIKKALAKCNYPNWAISKVKNQRAKKDLAKTKTSKKANQDSTSKGMVVLSYIQGVSERLHRVYNKHNITTSHKPHSTLRKHLMHPKDKNQPSETADWVYEISCKNWDFTYVGETGRLLGTRLKEHRKEAEKISEPHKSAISDHVASTYHIIDWEGVKILHREDERYPRWIRESIWIRRRGTKAMNNEGGAAYYLNHQYDHLIQSNSRNTSSRNTNSASGSIHHTWSRDQWC